MSAKEDIQTINDHQSISVIGTGDFGRALAVRLIQGGYSVHFGSQDPERRRQFVEKINPCLDGVSILSIQEAMKRSEVIILAVNSKNYPRFQEYSDLVQGKILVDVSNPDKISKEKSAAEGLQELFPGAKVCKAFNTVSAYTLSESNPVAGNNRIVYVSADDLQVRSRVKRIAVDMGLQAMEMGGLQSARKLERAQQTLFLGWGWASIVTGICFTFWLIYITCREYVMGDREPSRWPLNTFNVIMACMAITNLALCYLPGCLAAFLQLAWGTKYRAFPRFLDLWLKMRKQLGLYGMMCAIIHAFISVLILQPAYFPYLFEKEGVSVYGYQTVFKLLTWRSETTFLLATLTTGLYVLLGITSLPSVGAILNWREWRFIQSYLGHACLLLACAHVCFITYGLWIRQNFVEILQGPEFLSLIFAFFALFFRIILWMPCINSYLWRIRKGFVRGVKKDVENGHHAKSSMQVGTYIQKQENHINGAFDISDH